MWVCSFQTHCYYHGTVEGIAGSTLALSTCDGLRYFLFLFFFNISSFDEAETCYSFIVSLNSRFFPPFPKFRHRKKKKYYKRNRNKYRKTWAWTEASSSWCECHDQKYLCRKRNSYLDEAFVDLKHSCKQLCRMNGHISKDKPFPWKNFVYIWTDFLCFKYNKITNSIKFTHVPFRLSCTERCHSQ